MVMRKGMFTDPSPQSAGVAIVVEVKFWGVLDTTVALVPVWLPDTPEELISSLIDDRRWGITGVEGDGGVGGRSSLLHMFVVQHLEVQLTIVCPWLVRVVFFKLHT